MILTLNSFIDWLAREGGALLTWWLVSLGATVAIFPLLFRLMRGLPSRGYMLARAAGILVISYLYWALNIFGALRNTPGNILFVAILVFAVGLVSYLTWKDREPLLPWLRDHARMILTAELVFIVCFFAWAAVRAMNPETGSTEKPMEMAFFTASRASGQFPPNDPWLSGYAISYYHFGYIMLGMFANLTNVSSGFAFGAASALLFALAGVGGYGIGFDLVAAQTKRVKALAPHLVGLLTLVMLLLMGNLGTVAIEIPYQTRALPESYFNFMDVKDRETLTPGGDAPTGQFPTNGWWWFNITRIIKDRNLDGGRQEIISEFPAFSFVLSDIHPHVLSLPFVLLAVGLALNLVLMGRGLKPWEFLFYAICFGGLIFLNTWDALLFGVLIGAEALRRLLKNGTGRFTGDDWLRMAGFALAISGTALALYLPFFVGFRSQAGGVAPALIFTTRITQFLLQVGTFVFILLFWLEAERRRAGRTFNFRFALQSVAAVIGVALVVLLGLSILFWLNADVRAEVYQMVGQSGGIASALLSVIARRIEGLPVLILLAAMIVYVVARLFAKPQAEPETRAAITYSPVTGFVLLLTGAGAVLLLIPEFGYIRDVFNSRLNMIFKLYYQGWILWSVAAGFAVWSVLRQASEIRLGSAMRTIFAVGTLVLVLAGLYFTPNAVYSRWNDYAGASMRAVNGGMSLDGTAALVGSADDRQAIRCLRALVPDDTKVVAEAMIEPSAYHSEWGRVSAASGIPTILGWPNHERQWRGSGYSVLAGTRLQDVETLYTTSDLSIVQGILKRYGVDYVFVGSTERAAYSVKGDLAKFDAFPAVCRVGDAVVYDVTTPGGAAITPIRAGG